MPYLNKVIELAPTTDQSLSETATVNCAVRPYFNIILDYNISEMFNFLMNGPIKFKSKTLNSNPEPQNRILNLKIES